MAWMEVLAPAKANLFLELMGRRTDGFHELETVMVTVSLFDRILLRRRRDDRIDLSRIICGPNHNPSVFSMPLDRQNLVWQALELIRERSGKRFGVDVVVQKNIPGQAGMGGGSSDAAATLVAANRMFALRQTPQSLLQMASQLGSDVPFFLNRGFARCTGRGERIQPLTITTPLDLVMAMPPQGLATPQVFALSQPPQSPRRSDPLEEGLVRGDLRQIGTGLWNRLQSAAETVCPWITGMRNEFERLNCSGHLMTGSGAAYFGLFANRHVATQAARQLSARLPQCSIFCLHTITNHANLTRYRP